MSKNSNGKKVIRKIAGRIKTTTLFFLILILVIGSVYLLFIRPYQTKWGSTEIEVSSKMPGDELVYEPSFEATRAITIKATPSFIFPWLAQMGYSKGGFYSYEWISNGGMSSADRIYPNYQDVKVGTFIPVSEDSVNGYTIVDIKKNEYIVWKATDKNLTYTWMLKPLDTYTTRLITRIRYNQEFFTKEVLNSLSVEFGDILMVKESMEGIKERAENDYNKSLKLY